MYGSESADTLTALNNAACCLYCLGRRGEARVRFERAWTLLSNVLGARHPRTVVTWRNLDRARKSHSSLRHTDLQEAISIRTDADKLLLGGEFTIKASLRPSTAGKKKKRGKSAKGKKK